MIDAWYMAFTEHAANAYEKESHRKLLLTLDFTEKVLRDVGIHSKHWHTTSTHLRKLCED
jgi:hypothetical protein